MRSRAAGLAAIRGELKDTTRRPNSTRNVLARLRLPLEQNESEKRLLYISVNSSLFCASYAYLNECHIALFLSAENELPELNDSVT